MANVITSYRQGNPFADDEERERELLDNPGEELGESHNAPPPLVQPSAPAPAPQPSPAAAGALQGAASGLMDEKLAGAAGAGVAASGAGAASAGAGPAAIVPVIADFLQERAAKKQAAQAAQGKIAGSYAASLGANTAGLDAQRFATSQKSSPMDYLKSFQGRR